MPEVQIVEEFALVRDFAIIMAVAGAAVVVFRKLNQPAILAARPRNTVGECLGV